MNRAMRVAVGAVVVLGVAYTAASWWVGGRIEAAYQAELATLQDRLGAGSITDQVWHRGLFRSSNDMVLHVPAPGSGGQELAVRVHDVLWHGPLAAGQLAWAVQDTRVQDVSGGDPAWLQQVTLEGAAHARTVYGLNGDLSGAINLPAGTLDAAQGPVQWDAAQLQWNMQPQQGSQVQGALRWPGMRWEVVDDPDAGDTARTLSYALGAVQAQFEVDAGSPIWLMPPGSIQARAERFAVRAAPQDDAVPSDDKAPDTSALLQLQDLMLQGRTQVQDGLLQDDSTWTATGFVGGAPLGALRATTHLERVDAAAFAQLQPELLRWLQEGVLDARASDSALQRLSAAGPQAALTLEATLAGQPGSVHASASLDPAGAVQGLLRALPWQLQIIPRAQVDVALRLPQAWVPPLAAVLDDPDLTSDRLDVALNEMARRGLLVRVGDAWGFSASYARTQLLLNGKPPLNGLLGALAQLGGVGR